MILKYMYMYIGLLILNIATMQYCVAGIGVARFEIACFLKTTRKLVFGCKKGPGMLGIKAAIV